MGTGPGCATPQPNVWGNQLGWDNSYNPTGRKKIFLPVSKGLSQINVLWLAFAVLEIKHGDSCIQEKKKKKDLLMALCGIEPGQP